MTRRIREILLEPGQEHETWGGEGSVVIRAKR